jgi:hypothetical protein
MRFRGVTAAIVTGTTMAACSLFTGLDGFSDPPTGASEGGTDSSANETGTIDAAPASDSAAPIDAGADARFCFGKTAALCQDFDDDDPLAGWTQVSDVGTTLDVVTAGWLSPPRALRAGVATYAEYRSAYASRSLSNLGDVIHARLSYALYVEARPTMGEIEIGNLRFTCGGTCRSDFYIAVNGTDADLAEQAFPADGGPGDSNYHPLGAKIPTGKWLRLSLEVTLKGTREMVLTVDGAEVLREPTFLVTPGVPVVGAGVTYASKATTAASVVVDDVLFEVLP